MGEGIGPQLSMGEVSKNLVIFQTTTWPLRPKTTKQISLFPFLVTWSNPGKSTFEMFLHFLRLSMAATVLWFPIPTHLNFCNNLPASGHSNFHSLPSELLPQISLLSPSKILRISSVKKILNSEQSIFDPNLSFQPHLLHSSLAVKPQTPRPDSKSGHQFSEHSLILFHLASAQAAVTSAWNLLRSCLSFHVWFKSPRNLPWNQSFLPLRHLSYCFYHSLYSHRFSIYATLTTKYLRWVFPLQHLLLCEWPVTEMTIETFVFQCCFCNISSLVFLAFYI